MWTSFWVIGVRGGVT
jgi:hypothetical protein